MLVDAVWAVLSFSGLNMFDDFEFWEVTLPQINMAPENWWLEDEFSFGKPYLQVLS